jgi:hypothetical protein
MSGVRYYGHECCVCRRAYSGSRENDGKCNECRDSGRTEINATARDIVLFAVMVAITIAMLIGGCHG